MRNIASERLSDAVPSWAGPPSTARFCGWFVTGITAHRTALGTREVVHSVEPPQSPPTRIEVGRSEAVLPPVRSRGRVGGRRVLPPCVRACARTWVLRGHVGRHELAAPDRHHRKSRARANRDPPTQNACATCFVSIRRSEMRRRATISGALGVPRGDDRELLCRTISHLAGVLIAPARAAKASRLRRSARWDMRS